jgi:hypothetical protein
MFSKTYYVSIRLIILDIVFKYIGYTRNWYICLVKIICIEKHTVAICLCVQTHGNDLCKLWHWIWALLPVTAGTFDTPRKWGF